MVRDNKTFRRSDAPRPDLGSVWDVLVSLAGHTTRVSDRLILAASDAGAPVPVWDSRVWLQGVSSSLGSGRRSRPLRGHVERISDALWRRWCFKHVETPTAGLLRAGVPILSTCRNRLSEQDLLDTAAQLGFPYRTVSELAGAGGFPPRTAVAQIKLICMSRVPLRDSWTPPPPPDPPRPLADAVEETVRSGYIQKELAEQVMWSLIRSEASEHLGLVRLMSQRLQHSYPQHSAEDLLGWGWYGLRLALRVYDPAVASFSTYATTRIRGSMMDGVRKESHLPKRLFGIMKQFEKKSETLVSGLGRVPQLREVAESLGVTKQLMREIPRYLPPLSADSPAAEGKRGWVPSAPDSTAGTAETKLVAEEVVSRLYQLPEQQRKAVLLLVAENLSVPEAVSVSGLSARELRAAKDDGLNSLRELL